MSFQINFQRTADLFQVEIDGPPSDWEISLLIEQIGNHPASQSTRKQIILIRTAWKTFSLGLLRELLGGCCLDGNKRVAVVLEDEQDYIRVQTDQMTRKELPPEIQLFSLEIEAAQWLAKS
jgi:hypothetical protein